MSKVVLLFFGLLALNLSWPRYAFAQTSPLCSNLTPPVITSTSIDNIPIEERSIPYAGEQFRLNFTSPSIKEEKSYHIKIRTDDKYPNSTIFNYPNKTPGVDGSFSYTDPRLRLPEGKYRIQLFELGFLDSQNFICFSDPFAVGLAADAPPPANSCSEFKAEIKDKKIVLSGKGTLATGSYRPYINRVDQTQTPLGGESEILDINSDGSFGPREYDLLKNYPGGKTTIGLWHSSEGQVAGCTTEVDLVNTQEEVVKICPPSVEEYKAHQDKYLKPEDCASGGGDPCDTKDNRGPAIKTAIGCIHTNPTEFVKDLMTFIIGISGGLAFLMMLLGAFQMLTSAGNPDTLHAGRERLTSAMIGLLIVIFATLLLQIIGFDILKIPGFGR